ncbi:hypothetical protein DFH27DRAFT_565704 [Peziza echinospora]|nr:hypothetical protein DFH27DRAFT_565704 [Peziza echinospora]
MDETLRSVLSDWPESRYFQKAPLLFLQAVVAQYVVEYILGPFLLGQFKDEERLFGQGDDNDANSSDGERDIRDLQRWRNLTATISSRSEKFQKTVSDELDVHAIQLQNIICGITGNGDDTKRTRALRSKVLQPASELAILCHQQPDRFLYNFGELPGTKRKTSKYKLQDIIVDVNGQRRENELRKSEVAFYVSPLIRRVTLVGGGDAAIVAKARVYLIKQSWLY